METMEQQPQGPHSDRRPGGDAFDGMRGAPALPARPPPGGADRACRAIVGTVPPQAFDLAGYQAGRAVAFNQAVAFVAPETVATGQAASLKSVVPGTNTFQERSLMIRDLGVVTDAGRTWNPCTGAGNPNGVWTFNHLLTEMANQTASGIDPARFVETWLSHWQANQTINTHVVPPRTQVSNSITPPW